MSRENSVKDLLSFRMAQLEAVNLEFGPLYYESCGKTIGDTGRPCQKRLDAGGDCPRCGKVAPQDSKPWLFLNRASFEAKDATKLKLSAFGRVAENLLATTATAVREIEQQAVANGDAHRTRQAASLRRYLGRFFALIIVAERLELEEGKPFLATTIVEVMQCEEAQVAAEPTAKRGRTDSGCRVA